MYRLWNNWQTADVFNKNEPGEGALGISAGKSLVNVNVDV